MILLLEEGKMQEGEMEVVQWKRSRLMGWRKRVRNREVVEGGHLYLRCDLGGV